MSEGRFKYYVPSLSWDNSMHMYTCTFIYLYCKINFIRQVNTRYLINLPFFSTGIWQLGHGLVVFLIVSLDASSHRACLAACSSTTYPCKEREKLFTHDTRYVPPKLPAPRVRRSPSKRAQKSASHAANAHRQVKQKVKQESGEPGWDF